MRIGLVSDVHGSIPPELFERLRGVDRILFAGDVERPESLVDLAALARVDAVWGNVDGPDVRALTTEELVVDLGGVRFALAHGHRVAPRFELLLQQFPDADVVVHGHSHVPSRRESDGRWLVNPGAARMPRGTWPASLAIAEVEDGGVRFVHIRLSDGLPFDPAGEA